LSVENAWLYQYRENIFSQGGEDGVIQKVLERLPVRDKWCVEFGAMDGRHLSNSCHLIGNHGYSAVLIEGAAKPFKTLQEAYTGHPAVTTIHSFVGFETHDNLDAILRTTDIPQNFDLLSVDIDGNDYHVWKAFSQYQPKITVVEFNPTIGVQLDYVQEADPAVSKGSSLRSIVQLGKDKGYELVCVVGVNAVFVSAEYFPLYEIEDNSPETLWIDQSSVTHFFVTYDGEINLVGAQSLKWHRIPISVKKMQQLPKFLRNFPGNYTPIQRLLFAAFLLLKNPREFVVQFRKKVLRRP